MDAVLHVLIAHKSPLVRAGIAAMLHPHRDLALTQWDGRSPTPWREGHHDLVVTDYATGLLCAAEAAWAAPAWRVLVLTEQGSEWEVRDALARGVRGYLLIDCASSALEHAVRTVARGAHCFDEAVSGRIAESLVHAALTQREHEVLRLLAQGCANKTIAQRLGIAVGTVKAHVKSILDKLQVQTRTQAAAVAQARGMLRTPIPDRPPTQGATPLRRAGVPCPA